jgi:hypothetical protein
MGIFVVIKNPKHAIQPHVNTRRLNHFQVEWLNGDALIINFSQ